MAGEILRYIFSGNEVGVREILLSDPEQATALDLEKRSPLHAAAFCNLPDVAEDLIGAAAGAEATDKYVNGKDSRCLTPLHRACRVNAHEVVAVLLANGADPNSRDKQRQTPAHVAASNGATESLRLLLDAAASVPFKLHRLHVGDRAGSTCLHLAAYHGHVDAVQLLLQHGAQVDEGDKHNRTALHWAAYWHRSVLVRLLLESVGADPNAQDKDGHTPLHYVTANHPSGGGRRQQRRQEDVGATIALLTQAGGDVRARSRTSGNTPMHTACLTFNSKVLDHLLAAVKEMDDGDDVTELVNKRKETPLHLAAKVKEEDDAIPSNPVEMCVEILLGENRSPAVDRDVDGRTPLHLACVHGCCMRVRLLLDGGGANVNVSDRLGVTPLHLAVENGHALVVDLLLRAGADVEARDVDGQTPLHLCTSDVVIGKLCGAAADPTAYVKLVDGNRMTSLHLCAHAGNVAALNSLLRLGADPEVADGFGRVALHYAAALRRHDCLESLVDAAASNVVNARDAKGCSALHFAASSKDDDDDGRTVRLLLDRGADPRVMDGNGHVALHYASSAGNLTAMRMLLRVAPAGGGCLYFAAANGHEDALEILLPFEDVNAAHDGSTALNVAATNGHARVVELLLDRGAAVLSIPSALHHSARRGHSDCVSVIIDHVPAVVNVRDGRKQTALMVAASRGHLHVCTLLLERRANVDARDAMGRTALYMAAANGHDLICERLLERGADVRLADRNGKSPAHAASIAGNVRSLCTVLDHLQDSISGLVDADSFTPMHWAAFLGRERCLKLLLSKDDDSSTSPFPPAHCAAANDELECLKLLHFDVRDHLGRTALHVAALKNSYECCDFLAPNVDLAAVDKFGRTALMMAATKGNVRIVRLLLTSSKSCGVHLVDRRGDTALHHGCRSSSNVADVILESDVDVSQQNEVGQTALHLAASRGLVTTTETLLMRGASVVTTDKRGLSPALACAPNDNVVRCLAMILAVLLTRRPSIGSSSRASEGFCCESTTPPPLANSISNGTFTVLNGTLDNSNRSSLNDDA